MRVGLILPWLVILAFALGLPVLTALGDRPSASAPTSQPVKSELPSLQVQVQGKYILGVSGVMPAAQRATLVPQMTAYAKNAADQIVVATVEAELVSKEAALARLKPLDTPSAIAFRETYENQTALPAKVREDYGYFAELAETHHLPATDDRRAAVLSAATRTTFVVVGAMGVGIILLLAGLTLFVIALVRLSAGKLRFRSMPPLANADIYAQTFALYLILFFGTSVLLGLMGALPQAAKAGVLIIPIVIASAYPLLCGVRPSMLRTDWGLSTGRGLFTEIGLGLIGYIACLPIIGVGFLITLLLTTLTGTDASHPIATEVSKHPWTIFFLASIFAPVTEELFFRGCFFSHCRRFLNPWASGLLVGLIFAAIHPQGWAAIPALGMIGFSLALLRHWRGSLVAPMTAHALNNTTVLLLVLSLGL